MAGEGTENQPGAASGQGDAQNQEGAASTGAGDGAQENQEEKVTIPKGEYEKLQNDFKSMVGRMRSVTALEQERDSLRAAVSSNESQTAVLQQQLDALEDERLSGKPPEMQSLLKEKRQLRARLATLESENATLKKSSGKLAELEKAQRAMQVAAETGVKLEDLADYLDLPEEKLRALAVRLKGAGGANPAGDQAPPKKGMSGDSLAGRGAPAMSDKDFLAKYQSGEIPDSPQNHKKAATILQSMGINVGR